MSYHGKIDVKYGRDKVCGKVVEEERSVVVAFCNDFTLSHVIVILCSKEKITCGKIIVKKWWLDRTLPCYFFIQNL